MSAPGEPQRVRHTPGSRFLALLPGLAALLLFLPAVRFGVLNYDDPVTLGLDGHPAPDLAHCWQAPGLLNLWHPLTTASHALALQLTAGPWLAHLLNVLLHAASAVTCGLLFRRLTGQPGPALAAALAFALHPWNAEPVAWITARKDVLSTFCMLQSLLAWSIREEKAPPRLPVAALLWGVAALLSKPIAVVLPVLLGIVSAWRRTGNRPLPWRPLLFAALPAAALAVLTIHWQESGGHAGLDEARPLTGRPALACAALLHYLRSAVWPGTPRLFVYPPVGTALALHAVAGAAAAAAISLAAFRNRHRLPSVWFGWLWFLTLFLPVSGLIPVSWYLGADRYMHAAQAGLWISLATLAHRFLPPRWHGRLLAATCAALAAATVFRLPAWQDSGTLFTAEMERNPASLLAPIQLGDLRLREGRNTEALALFSRALTLAPHSAIALTNAGIARHRLGDDAGAVPLLQAAIQSGNARSARAWTELGSLYASTGNTDLALTTWAEGLAAFPDDIPLLQATAACRAFTRNEPGPALALYERLLRLRPRDPDALRDSGLILCTIGRPAEGQARLRLYLTFRPGDLPIQQFLERASAP